MSDAELARREAFAQAYCAHGSLCKAAQIAGYTGIPNTLTKRGRALIDEPAVAARIKEIRDQLYHELGITQRFVLSQLKRIASFDIAKCFNADGTMKNMPDIDEDTRQALQGFEITEKTFGSGDDAMESVERKIKAAPKMDALTKLGQHTGLFKQEGGANVIDATAFVQALLNARHRLAEHRRSNGEGEVARTRLIGNGRDSA